MHGAPVEICFAGVIVTDVVTKLAINVAPGISFIGSSGVIGFRFFTRGGILVSCFSVARDIIAIGNLTLALVLLNRGLLFFPTLALRLIGGFVRLLARVALLSSNGARTLSCRGGGVDGHGLQQRGRAQHVGEQNGDDAVKPFHTGDQLSPRILHTPAIVAAGSSKSNRGAILNGYWTDGVEGGTRIVEMELIASDAGPGTPITSGASIVELESASNPMPSSNFLISIPWNGLGFAG